MLGLQASNLEQQERLFKNQIKLGLREILQQELNFYNQAFNNISSCASILAGFAFTGLMLDPFDHKNDLQPNWLKTFGCTDDGTENCDPDMARRIETTFNFMCALTTCLCLLTVVYSNYLGLFATRLALRGGDMAVEDSVMKIRGEYKVVLYALTASVETFIITLPVLAFYKMELEDAGMVTAVCLPSCYLVIYLYRRARGLFYLDKDDRFAAAKKKRHGGNKAIHLDDDGVNSSGGQGGRLSTLVGDFDHRNQSDLSPQQLAAAGLGDFVNRGSIGPRGSVGSVGGRTMHRRSLSDGVGRGSTAGGYYEEGNAATTSVPAGKRKAYWGGFFKSKS